MQSSSFHTVWPQDLARQASTRDPRQDSQSPSSGRCGWQLSVPNTYVRDLCSGLVLRLPLCIKASPSRSCSHSLASPCAFPYCWSPASRRTAGRPGTAQQPGRAEQPEMHWDAVWRGAGQTCTVALRTQLTRAGPRTPALCPHTGQMGQLGRKRGSVHRLCPRAPRRPHIHVPGNQV